MWSTREIIIFLAGAQTFHTLSHIIFALSRTLPIKFWFITWNQQLNLIAIIINVIVMVGLFWWLSKLK